MACSTAVENKPYKQEVVGLCFLLLLSQLASLKKTRCSMSRLTKLYELMAKMWDIFMSSGYLSPKLKLQNLKWTHFHTRSRNPQINRGSIRRIPLVRFQSMALRVAFSRGSPTRPSSSWTSEWQVARTLTLSGWTRSIGWTTGTPEPEPELSLACN